MLPDGTKALLPAERGENWSGTVGKLQEGDVLFIYMGYKWLQWDSTAAVTFSSNTNAPLSNSKLTQVDVSGPTCSPKSTDSPKQHTDSS